MATYTQIDWKELSEILSPYQLKVVDFKPIARGNTNSNYYLRAEDGEYMLTIIEERSSEEILQLVSLLQWLKQHDFHTSEVYFATDGRSVTNYASKPILLKKWLPGAVTEVLLKDQLVQVGKEMAKLHQIPAPDYVPTFHPYGHQTFSAVIGKDIDPHYEAWLKNRLDYFEREFPKNLPTGLIHGDIFSDNVLFEQQVLKAIIDLEEACHFTLVLDIAMGILGLCQVDGKIDLGRAYYVLDGYQQIRTLEDSEQQFLPFFIEYAAASTSCWRFRKYHIQTPSPHLSNKHRDMMQIAQQIGKLSSFDFQQALFPA